MSHLLLSRAHLSLQLQLFFATRLSLSLRLSHVSLSARLRRCHGLIIAPSLACERVRRMQL